MSKLFFYEEEEKKSRTLLTDRRRRNKNNLTIQQRRVMISSEEERLCLGCKKVKKLTGFRITTRTKQRNSHYCRDCWLDGTNIPITEWFRQTEERKLIPIIEKDLELLRKKAEEIGLTRLTKEERDEE